MTMQIMDSFSYRGERAEMIAISHRFSFSPANNFGIVTASWATTNYRGFWYDCSIGDSFVISNLYLFSKDHLYPLINGKKAEEIPVFCHVLDDINQNACIPKQYQDCFPMQYTGINYDYEYSGRIVLGISLNQNESGQERYRRIMELSFDKGIVIENLDITKSWRQTGERQDKGPGFWWGQEDNDYSYLINYKLMGINESRNSEIDSG